jgi:branched-chain amino acid transport system permease protein
MTVVLQVLASGLLIGGLYALLAVGLTFIFGVLRVVNFAHGEFMMLGMYGAYWLWARYGLDPYLASLVVIPAIYALGLILARAVVEPAVGAPDVTVVFATLGLSIALQNAALSLWGPDIRSITTPYSNLVLPLGSVRLSAPLLISFAVALLLALGLWLVLERTLIGRAIQAVAQHRSAAALMGINVRRVYRLTYAVAITAAAAMGVLIAPTFSVFPRVGQSYIVTAFVIVVLGGLGSIPGAIISALLIGIVRAAVGFWIGVAWAELAYFILFIIVLIARPQGLFGRRGAEVFK